jgi:c-di-GMP-binding flagellar brake protein YcgR
MTFKERRRAKRVDANLAVTISGAPEGEQGRTLNISANGIYFESPKFIDLLTKVQLELVIPLGGPGSGKEERITCEGVVVRVEPEHEEPGVSRYNIAVFFAYIPKSAQAVLSRYIKSRLSSE